MSIGIPTGVGDSNAQRRFINSHTSFLQEFPALQSLIEETFRLSANKCYPESPTKQTAAEPTDEQLAQRVVFYLERAVFDDFGELLILAGNGMGIGAKKTLRSMYERLVKAMFIAKYPHLELFFTPVAKSCETVLSETEKYRPTNPQAEQTAKFVYPIAFSKLPNQASKERSIRCEFRKF
jgi:hypothetical protein